IWLAVAIMFLTPKPLPNEPSVHLVRDYFYQRAVLSSLQSNGQGAPTALQGFIGLKREDPADCYDGEKAGDCAARIVQEGVAGFYYWLVIAALTQAAAAIGAIIVVGQQTRIMRDQATLMDSQLRASQIAA